MDMSDDEYDEVLDVRGSNSTNWLRGITGNVSRETALKQAGIGAATGMLSGFLFVKVGRVAAATIGSTVLLIQIAQHQGYVQINWDKVRRTSQAAERELRRVANSQMPGVFENFRVFLQENLFLAVGFGGGFLLGMAC